MLVIIVEDVMHACNNIMPYLVICLFSWSISFYNEIAAYKLLVKIQKIGIKVLFHG